MKVIILIVLFCIIQSSWEFSFFQRNFSTRSPPPTYPTNTCQKRTWTLCYIGFIRITTDSCTKIIQICGSGKIAYTPSRCKGKPRKWTICFEARIRISTDNCTKKIEKCSNGTLVATNFIKTFIPANILSLPDGHIPYNNRTFVCSHGKCSSLIRRKRQIPSFTPKRDLLFMIDESGSVGIDHFGNAKRIVTSIIKLLCGNQKMHPDNTRVSVMSFDSVNHLHMPLLHPTNPYLNTNAEALSYYILGNVKYNSSTAGSTCLNDALLYARDNPLNTSGSRRGEQHVLQEIIILTDGCANCGGSNSIQSTVDALDADGIKIYVLGIGLSSFCKYTLRALASRGNCFHFFYLDRWDYDLNDFVEGLTNTTDPNGKPYCLHQLIGSSNQCTPPN